MRRLRGQEMPGHGTLRAFRLPPEPPARLRRLRCWQILTWSSSSEPLGACDFMVNSAFHAAWHR
jgi:hypothetical protein